MNDYPNNPNNAAYPPHQGYPPHGQPPEQGYGQPYDQGYAEGHPPQQAAYGQGYDRGYPPSAYPPGQGDPYAQPYPPYPQPPYGPPPGSGRSAVPFIIAGVLLVMVIGAVLAVVVNRGTRAARQPGVAAARPSAGAPLATTAPTQPSVGEMADRMTSTAGVPLGQLVQINQAARQIVDQVSPRLPVTISVLTLTNIAWDAGKGLILTGTVNREMSSDDWDGLNSELQRELCKVGYDGLTRVGGAVRVDLTDTIGNSSSTIWKNCPTT